MTNLALMEEISWLRGRGWNATSIAKKLECPIELVMLRVGSSATDQELFDAGSAARREARLVYTRCVRQYGRP